jgi:hypothetical protein
MSAMKRPGEASKTSRPMKTTLLGLAALLLAGGFAARQLSSWPARLRYPGEENLAEGMCLAEMEHLRRGVAIYAPPSPERFDASIYGPLYYLVGTRLIDPERPAYLPLRLISMLGTLGCAAGCALLAFWLSGRLLTAGLASLTFLSYGIVSIHGLSARADLVALCLSFAGFLVAYRFRNSNALMLAAPLMLAGFFYKQQFVAGPLAVLVYLLHEKRYRHTLWFVAALAGEGLALLGYLEWVIFPGEAILLHFFRYNLVSFAWSSFQIGMIFLGLILVVPTLMGLEYLRHHRDWLLGCYLAFAFLLSIVPTAKVGSDTNYFLEFVLILSVLFSALLAEGIGQQSDAGVLIALLAVTLFLSQWFARPAPDAQDTARDEAIQRFLRKNFEARSPALGYYAGDLVRAGLEVPISNIYQYAQLVRKGTLSDRELMQQFVQGRFNVIILTFDIRREVGEDWSNNYLTIPQRRAIMENYRLAAIMDLPGPERFKAGDRFYAWVPRSGPSTSGSEPSH